MRKKPVSFEVTPYAQVPFCILFLLLGMLLPETIGAESFRDALGREVSLVRVPQRIIALAPSVTETLFSLGLGDRVVGVTEFSDHLPEAASKPKVGSFIHLNVEKIIDLKPDLVIASADRYRPGLLELLDQAGVKAYVVNPKNLLQVIECVRGIGRLCGVSETADALAMKLTSRLERVVEKTKGRRKPLVLFQINIKPIMTVNRETLHHDLIRLAGGENLFGDEPLTYPRISVEEVIRRGPEVIIISSMERGGHFDEARQEWFRWKSIPAVRDGRVFLIDSDTTDRPSPRAFVGLERMARLLHPEAVWEVEKRTAE
ncbi:MAG: cobalamin-binding protein [Thermodesulfobacteriota bacterium]